MYRVAGDTAFDYLYKGCTLSILKGPHTAVPLNGQCITLQEKRLFSTGYFRPAAIFDRTRSKIIISTELGRKYFRSNLIGRK